MKNIAGQRIIELRKERGMDQKQLCRILAERYSMNTPQSTISRWETGSQEPTITNLKMLAEIFDVSLDYICGQTNDRRSIFSTNKEILVPVVAEIAAGFDKQPIRDYEMDRFPVPSVYAKGRRTDELFIIKVRGDSMYPMYQEGDHLLAVRTPTVEDGEVAILQYEDNATIKRVERVKDGLRLIPINPMYKSETVTDGDEVRVVGKPLVLIRELADDVRTS